MFLVNGNEPNGAPLKKIVGSKEFKSAKTRPPMDFEPNKHVALANFIYALIINSL